MAARACAFNPETIAVAVPRAGLVSGPVASPVFLQQAVVGEPIENFSAKNPVQVNRSGFRRPDPEGRAVRDKRRASWRLRRNVLLGKHGLLSLHHCHRPDRRQLLGCTIVAFRRLSIAQPRGAHQRDGVFRLCRRSCYPGCTGQAHDRPRAEVPPIHDAIARCRISLVRPVALRGHRTDQEDKNIRGAG